MLSMCPTGEENSDIMITVLNALSSDICFIFLFQALQFTGSLLVPRPYYLQGATDSLPLGRPIAHSDRAVRGIGVKQQHHLVGMDKKELASLTPVSPGNPSRWGGGGRDPMAHIREDDKGVNEKNVERHRMMPHQISRHTVSEREGTKDWRQADLGQRVLGRDFLKDLFLKMCMGILFASMSAPCVYLVPSETRKGCQVP